MADFKILQFGVAKFIFDAFAGEIQLKSCKSNSINKFEKDSSDLFYVECINLGPIQRLQIWHDATGTVTIVAHGNHGN